MRIDRRGLSKRGPERVPEGRRGGNQGDMRGPNYRSKEGVSREGGVFETEKNAWTTGLRTRGLTIASKRPLQRGKDVQGRAKPTVLKKTF